MITIANVLTFTTGGVLGYLLRTLIDHRLARSRSIEAIQIAEFNKAAAAFRSAFTNEIRELSDSNNAFVIQDIVSKSYISHANAFINFKPYLSASRTIEFQKAWDKHCWNNESGQQYPQQMIFLHYTYLDNEVDQIDCRQLALNNINRLLSFTEL